MSQPIALLSNDGVLQAVLRAVVTRHGYVPAVFSLDPHVVRQLADQAPAAIVLDMPLAQPARAWQMVGLIRLARALTQTPIIVCTDAAVPEEAAVLGGTGVTLLRTPCLYALGALLTTLCTESHACGAA